MKVEKLPANGRHPALWEFARDHLPSSLRATCTSDGYGSIYAIEVREPGLLNLLRSGIATVGREEIELRHPEYFSDFEDLCRKYEAATGREVTLRFWESG